MFDKSVIISSDVTFFFTTKHSRKPAELNCNLLTDSCDKRKFVKVLFPITFLWLCPLTYLILCLQEISLS